jgi:hypothetical protein
MMRSTIGKAVLLALVTTVLASCEKPLSPKEVVANFVIAMNESIKGVDPEPVLKWVHPEAERLINNIQADISDEPDFRLYLEGCSEPIASGHDVIMDCEITLIMGEIGPEAGITSERISQTPGFHLVLDESNWRVWALGKNVCTTR